MLGRTLGGYGFVPLELALVAVFYYATNRWLGWWQPSEVLTDPNILSSAIPALMPIAVSLQAGFMEECLFRAVPLALGALIGAHFGRRRTGIAIAFVLQAVIFGGAHANYPGFPSYSRLVELVVPSMLWAAIFLRFGLLPTILLHALFDLALFSIPLFLVDAPGAGLQRASVFAAALVPLGVVLWRRVKAGAWGEMPEALRNRAWMPRVVLPERAPPPPRVMQPSRGQERVARSLPYLGLAGLVAWVAFTPMHADVPPIGLDRAAAEAAADAALKSRGVVLGPEWRRFSTVRDANEEPQWEQHKFVWREAGRGRLPRADRHIACASGVGCALRDLRRRRGGASRGVARDDRARGRGAPGAAPVARGTARRPAVQGCRPRPRRTTGARPFRRRSRNAQARGRGRTRSAGTHRLGLRVRGSARRRG